MTTAANETVEMLAGLCAADVMTRHVATVGEEATVAEALTLMRLRGVRHLPVTTGDGRFVGMVDDRLVARALLTGSDREQALNQSVDEVMMRYVPQVGPQTPVGRVCRLLKTSRTDAVVVVDDQDRLRGLITLVDVVGAVAHSEL